ncbi:hypothetical protein L914_11954 [Phytophthora nicotianae]|uniref:Uncharacterized protein n=2 Tax=Phytophthora nicotianae TaxID=4792 RepID=V9EUE8_PHYNI|nr:hypothetical protein F443_12395 [Phytophthora nicotianae P1569]ETM42377.1 hypothetical protein L914_11954 [Phytophthora nicotianae]
MATSSSPAAKKRVLWDRDGVNGGPSSMKILLDWLTTEGNYTKKPADVRDKIQNLESKYRTAVAWLANTGQGVTDEKSIRSALVK